MHEVYVAAGSNVEPVAMLNRALVALEKHYAPLAVSKAYRNRAVGFEGEDFINLAVGFRTGQDLKSLIGTLQAIEASCGRGRDAPRWAPRAMDLDILLYDDMVCDEPDLKLPRPDLVKRAYMLGPMADIAPQLRHPTLDRTLGELWAEFDRGHEMIPVDLGAR